MVNNYDDVDWKRDRGRSSSKFPTTTTSTAGLRKACVIHKTLKGLAFATAASPRPSRFTRHQPRRRRRHHHPALACRLRANRIDNPLRSQTRLTLKWICYFDCITILPIEVLLRLHKCACFAVLSKAGNSTPTITPSTESPNYPLQSVAQPPFLQA